MLSSLAKLRLSASSSRKDGCRSTMLLMVMTGEPDTSCEERRLFGRDELLPAEESEEERRKEVRRPDGVRCAASALKREDCIMARLFE